MATPTSARTRAKKAPKAPARPKLTDDELEQIKQLHSEGKGRNEIAETLGRAAATITSACKKLGLAFDESQTVEATAARVAQMKAKRIDLAEQLLDDALKIRERLWSPHHYYEKGPDSLVPVTLPLPPLRDTRDGYGALQIALKGHMELVSESTDTGIEGKRSVLANLISGIKSAVAEDRANGGEAPDMSLAANDGDVADPITNASAGEESPS
ncbi:helix-turn-helix domain-containing protein [Rhodococcus rhodochrous]|uniref:helix-turn-helix domain-containing protein n=1 Tax=Rhodococcus rhodochrous TaxID=1829 RepID=UPI001786274E|nr:helix-turn-helix domain-containing protein [Rhodococcus rhodochrous]QOH59901.1 hypothetical protein C6Y44_27825 [Rhodococcus rhodochrous]